MAIMIETRISQLPIELQTKILVELYLSTVVRTDYGEILDDIIPEIEHDVPRAYTKLDGSTVTAETLPLYELVPEDLLSLELYASFFHSDAYVSWESYVTFYFPSAVAMYDILSSEDFWIRRSLIRYVELVGGPITLNGNLLDVNSLDTNQYPCTHFLSTLTGLQLNCLVIKDLALSGDEGFSRDMYILSIVAMILSQCWWYLEIVGPNPHFTKDEVWWLAQQIKQHREDGFRVTLPKTFDRVGSATYLPPGAVLTYDEQGRIIADPPPEWEYPADLADGSRFSYHHSAEQNVFETILTARRGRDVDILSTGYKQTPAPWELLIEDAGICFLNNETWLDMRRAGRQLVDEGREDIDENWMRYA